MRAILTLTGFVETYLPLEVKANDTREAPSVQTIGFVVIVLSNFQLSGLVALSGLEVL
jgi:hypothetical protein